MTTLISKICRWRDRSVSRRQLVRFDARTLNDLGMRRGDIDRVVRVLRESKPQPRPLSGGGA